MSTTIRTTTGPQATAGTVVALDDLAVRVRPDFPILTREVNGKPLVYLDSAASSQKPRAVLDAMDDYYTRHNANVHRGVHTLAEEATRLFEQARGKVAGFVGASERATVFTKNATEAINLVAWGWGLRNLREGDELLVSEMEHHANLVPWQLVAKLTGARLAAIPVTDAYALDLDALDGLGLVFLAFTGHKMLGPMGVGVLAALEELLDGMEPFLGGGEMLRDVSIQASTWNDIPWRFEAGTPNVAEAIGLGAAVDYLGDLGMDAVRAHERAVTGYALERLAEVDGLRVLGPPATEQRGGAVSFVLDGVHPHDVAQVLDADGIAVRAGHHCAKPLMTRFGLAATTRASFYVYSTRGEVDALVGTLGKVRKLFG